MSRMNFFEWLGGGICIAVASDSLELDGKLASRTICICWVDKLNLSNLFSCT